MRSLTPGEVQLARQVFGPELRPGPIRLHLGGFGRFAVTIGSRLFIPPQLFRDDFSQAEPLAQALLVHELVHVWQFQTRPARTLASWAKQVATGGYGPGLPAYRYRLPVPVFERLGLEQQASVVEHLFLLRRGLRVTSIPTGVGEVELAAATPFPVEA